MKRTIISILILASVIAMFAVVFINAEKKSQEKKMDYNKLTAEEERVILRKGTEMPFIGKYTNHTDEGIYICKQCNSPLYNSADKFDSHCGWPSFDDEIAGAIKKIPDADGYRTEIICNNCGGHLGHVFYDEELTPKNTRHCVNSISLNFIPADTLHKKKAYFAGGCFWGIESLFKQLEGVTDTKVGYMGGRMENPTYEQVCYSGTGHAEAIEVTYNTDKTNFEKLAKYFFEIHDPTQLNRQGPDIGDQYRSVVFYNNEEEKLITETLINILKQKGYKVVTELEQATKFWVAEDYHQDYYNKTGKQPYCHFYIKRF